MTQVKNVKKILAGFLALVLVWAGIGLVPFFGSLQAATLTSVSDTLTNSAPGALSDHTIKFTSPSGATSTVQIRFVANTENFDISSITTGDISVDVAGTAVTVVTGAPAADQWQFATSTDGGDMLINFTLGTGTAVIPASGTSTIVIGLASGGTNQIVNPDPTLVDGIAKSYQVYVTTDEGSATEDFGGAHVAIITDVVMRAAIDTTLEFTIAGVNTGVAINGETTTRTSTATVIDFGTLTIDTPEVMGQKLNVTTNASQGFIVTLVQNQNLTSSQGDEIHLFVDGTPQTSPIAWAPPSNTFGATSTYGHYGVTTNDANLHTDTGSGDDNFSGGSVFVGNIDNPRILFAHNFPSDGLEPSEGEASIAIKIEVGSLQAAGFDYQNVLTYVATPTF